MAFLQRAPDSTPTRSPFLTLDALLLQCDQIFGDGTSLRLQKQNEQLQTLHGGQAPNGTSQIYFSNFSDDPWQSASVKPLVKHDDDLPRCYVVCDDCGHCMDLHKPQETDPSNLKTCRAKGAEAVKRWVDDWHLRGTDLLSVA
eukprot:scaffold165757_cov48-Prasinocladus_malaysianus.AAC.3